MVIQSDMINVLYLGFWTLIVLLLLAYVGIWIKKRSFPILLFSIQLIFLIAAQRLYFRFIDLARFYAHQESQVVDILFLSSIFWGLSLLINLAGLLRLSSSNGIDKNIVIKKSES